MTRFELKHTGDKDEVLREWELLRDCINTRAEEKNNINSSYNSSLCWLLFIVHYIKVRKKNTNKKTNCLCARTDF